MRFSASSAQILVCEFLLKVPNNDLSQWLCLSGQGAQLAVLLISVIRQQAVLTLKPILWPKGHESKFKALPNF